MVLLRLDSRTWSLCLGLREVRVERPEAWLSELRREHPSLIVQAVSAQCVAGKKHAERILKQAWEAKKRGLLYAERFELDILLRFACNLQIREALEAVGLKPGVQDVLLIAIGGKKHLEHLAQASTGLGTPSDRVLELTEGKAEHLRRRHRIPERMLDSTLVQEDHLAHVLAERAALLVAED